MTSSDIILVSDGEIPNPPVSANMMAKLTDLHEKTGMEIHGLLIGKKESPALSALCTSVHDFLVDYELTNLIRVAPGQRPQRSSTALNANRLPRSFLSKSNIWYTTKRSFRRNVSLHAFDNSSDGFYFGSQFKLLRKKDNRKRRFVDEEDYYGGWDYKNEDTGYNSDCVEESLGPATKTNNSDFVQRLEAAYESLQCTASLELKNMSHSDSEMEESDLLLTRDILSKSISYIESGLVERDGEARLVGKHYLTVLFLQIMDCASFSLL